MIPEETVAELLRTHTERMHAISATATAKNQELMKKLVANLKDPLTIKAEIVAGKRPLGGEEMLA